MTESPDLDVAAGIDAGIEHCDCLQCRLTALHREITQIVLAVSLQDKNFADAIGGLALDLSRLILRAPRLQLAAPVAQGYDSTAAYRLRAAGGDREGVRL